MTERICPHCRQPINLSLIVEDAVPAEVRSVGDIKFLVRKKVVDASEKEVYNALAFLTRYGRIERVGYGRYRRGAFGEPVTPTKEG